MDEEKKLSKRLVVLLFICKTVYLNFSVCIYDAFTAVCQEENANWRIVAIENSVPFLKLKIIVELKAFHSFLHRRGACESTDS